MPTSPYKMNQIIEMLNTMKIYCNAHTYCNECAFHAEISNSCTIDEIVEKLCNEYNLNKELYIT